MKTSIKHLSILFLFMGVVVTPTFAFESAPLTDVDLAVSDSTSDRSPAPHPTELQKIAEQVRGWNAPDDQATESDESSDSTSSDERFEERDSSDESQEIKKLDSIFFDYVMAKYIERVRRS